MFRDFETRSFGQLSLIIGRISSATATNVLIRNSVPDRSILDRESVRMRRMINIIPYIIFGINRNRGVDQPERSFSNTRFNFRLILPSMDYPIKICKIFAKIIFRREKGGGKRSTRYRKCEMQREATVITIYNFSRPRIIISEENLYGRIVKLKTASKARLELIRGIWRDRRPQEVSKLRRKRREKERERGGWSDLLQSTLQPCPTPLFPTYDNYRRDHNDV